jgi:hypothetical protein
MNAETIKITRTYGTNYNGTKLWARIYLPHGALKVNAANVGEKTREILLQDSLQLSVPLDAWRMDYNQNGIYLEVFDSGRTSAELEHYGFKRSKSN